jgi:hypothetical protein
MAPGGAAGSCHRACVGGLGRATGLHTGRPSLYLNDIDRASFWPFRVGSQVTIRLYGEVGALHLAETVSGRTGEIPPATDPSQSSKSFRAAGSHRRERDGRSWDVHGDRGRAPEIDFDGPIERTAGGRDAAGIPRDRRLWCNRRACDHRSRSRCGDRLYGLAVEPETGRRCASTCRCHYWRQDRLPRGAHRGIAKNPWAGLPVRISLRRRCAGQSGVDGAGRGNPAGPAVLRSAGRRHHRAAARPSVEQGQRTARGAGPAGRKPPSRGPLPVRDGVPQAQGCASPDGDVLAVRDDCRRSFATRLPRSSGRSRSKSRRAICRMRWSGCGVRRSSWPRRCATVHRTTKSRN